MQVAIEFDKYILDETNQYSTDKDKIRVMQMVFANGSEKVAAVDILVVSHYCQDNVLGHSRQRLQSAPTQNDMNHMFVLTVFRSCTRITVVPCRL